MNIHVFFMFYYLIIENRILGWISCLFLESDSLLFMSKSKKRIDGLNFLCNVFWPLGAFCDISLPI